jgi:hypothetical protein
MESTYFKVSVNSLKSLRKSVLHKSLENQASVDCVGWVKRERNPKSFEKVESHNVLPNLQPGSLEDVGFHNVSPNLQGDSFLEIVLKLRALPTNY